MLHSTRRDIEITQTYTLFTGILCWVMQRVRWPDDNTKLREPMARLREALEGEPFRGFVRRIARPPLREVSLPNPIPPGHPLNDFSARLAPPRGDMSSLDGLVLLRNAVAHGDHRRVVPLNDGQLLRGYQLECVKMNGKKLEWSAQLCLNRRGMAHIAEEIANRFCSAALHGGGVADANRIRENSRP